MQAAGLPPGVINLVYGDPKMITDAVLGHPALAGVHFTGSTGVFNGMLRSGERSGNYRSYPRIVGETGGKNFVLAHPQRGSRGAGDGDRCAAAYEYQGQKCSAASRVFVPQSLWPRCGSALCDEIASIRVGDVRDLRNFMGAVIDERPGASIDGAIDAGARTRRCRGRRRRAHRHEQGLLRVPDAAQHHGSALAAS